MEGNKLHLLYKVKTSSSGIAPDSGLHWHLDLNGLVVQSQVDKTKFLGRFISVVPDRSQLKTFEFIPGMFRHKKITIGQRLMFQLTLNVEHI